MNDMALCRGFYDVQHKDGRRLGQCHHRHTCLRFVRSKKIALKDTKLRVWVLPNAQKDGSCEKFWDGVFRDPCECNPETKQAAYEDEVHAEAEWIVGSNGKWRLCSQCASLPEFKKFRVRKRIQGKEAAND